MSFLTSSLRRSPAISSTSRVARTFATTRPSQLARLTIVGRLGVDPEVSETAKGPIVKYVVGSDYGPRESRQTSWFRVACLSNDSAQRDRVMGLTKGTLVYVEGDARLNSYEDGDGKKQTGFSVVQTKLDVLKRPQPKDEVSE